MVSMLTQKSIINLPTRENGIIQNVQLQRETAEKVLKQEQKQRRGQLIIFKKVTNKANIKLPYQ